ncbi:MAG: hypothetical protein ACREP9_17170, partial [Candidatus Dormibacteraceae bacterium]
INTSLHGENHQQAFLDKPSNDGEFAGIVQAAGKLANHKPGTAQSESHRFAGMRRGASLVNRGVKILPGERQLDRHSVDCPLSWSR